MIKTDEGIGSDFELRNKGEVENDVVTVEYSLPVGSTPAFAAGSLGSSPNVRANFIRRMVYWEASQTVTLLVWVRLPLA